MARSVMASGLGLELDLGACRDLAALPPDVALFSESNGRFIATVGAEDRERFEALLEDLPCSRVGRVVSDRRLTVRRGDRAVAEATLDQLRQSFLGGLADA